MMMKREMGWPAIVTLALVGQASLAHGATVPVTDWVIHNGAGTVDNPSTNSPSVTPADASLVLMAPFSAANLANDGDFVKVSATLTLETRSGDSLGETGLNTQLRMGLFDGPAGPVVAEDTPNTGIIIEYSDIPAGGLIREQPSAVQANPFVSPTNIGNGVQDAGDDHIQGSDIGPVLFELKLTRNGGMLDIAGQISGTDSVSGNPYLSTYTVTGHSPVGFSYDRVGLFFGPRADGDLGTTNPDFTATLHNVIVSTPEPSSCLLAAILAFGGAMVSRRRAAW
jgi:hypothetical protein